MNVFILHAALAICLFYIVNWIGEHSSNYGYLQLSLFTTTDQAPAFNFILKTFAPVVYVILVSTVFYALHADKYVKGIWLVVVYYFLFRLLYNAALGRALLLDWILLLVQIVAGIGVALLAYRHLIVPRQPLLPDAQEVGNQLWVIIALFLYATLNNVKSQGKRGTRRKNRYVRSRLGNLRKLYSGLLYEQFPEKYMELVAYAILIHETFNRPWLARTIERALFPWGSKTLGPMQVRTDRRISDLESVSLGLNKLRDDFDLTNQEFAGKGASRYDIIRATLAKYNRDENYIREVFQILHILWAQIAPEYRTEFEKMYFPGAKS